MNGAWKPDTYLPPGFAARAGVGSCPRRTRPSPALTPAYPGLVSTGARVTSVPIWTLAAEVAGDPTSAISLAQYGAIGILLVAFVGFAFRSWKREADRSDRLEAEHRAERLRVEVERQAERQGLEGEIRRLHNDIQEKAIPALLASATALTAVTEILRDQQRERQYARPPRRDGEV